MRMIRLVDAVFSTWLMLKSRMEIYVMNELKTQKVHTKNDKRES